MKQQYKIACGVSKIEPTLDDETQLLRIHWDMLTICNNSCRYCYARHGKDWGRMARKEDIATLNLLIDRVLTDGVVKRVDVVLLGGEPTLHPNFTQIVKDLLKHENTHISVTSNGISGYKGKDNFTPEEKSRIRWAFTYHTAYEDPTGFTHRILPTGDEWWEVAISPFVDPSASDGDIGLCRNIIEFGKAHGFIIQPSFMYNPEDGTKRISMSEESWEVWSFLKEEAKYLVFDEVAYNDYSVFKKELNKFRGWRCYNNNWILSVTGFLGRACDGYRTSPITESFFSEYKPDHGWMTCTVDNCQCYGLLTGFKFKE